MKQNPCEYLYKRKGKSFKARRRNFEEGSKKNAQNSNETTFESKFQFYVVNHIYRSRQTIIICHLIHVSRKIERKSSETSSSSLTAKNKFSQNSGILGRDPATPPAQTILVLLYGSRYRKSSRQRSLYDPLVPDSN